MDNYIIDNVLNAMAGDLTPAQMLKLKNVLWIQLQNKPARQELAETDADGWSAAIKAFAICKRLENCATGTIRAYTAAVRALEADVNKPIRDVTKNDIRIYLARIKEGRNVSVSYMDTMRRYLHSFFEWATDEGVTAFNPVRGIGRMRVPKKMRKAFTPEEIERLREAAKTLRDRAIIETMLSTAARVGEIVRLDRAHIAGDEIILCGQKGKKERTAFLSPTCQYWIAKYLETRTDDNEALFVANIKPYERIGVRGVQTVLHNLEARTGIECYPHKFRRTAITTAARRGVPLQSLQMYAGHTDPKITMEYVALANEDVKRELAKYYF